MLGEKHEPIEEWAKPIIARGPRRRFEMEQVLPSSDPDEPDCDPIIEANALRDFGRVAQARRLLLRLIEQDPRCLDAHAHRGNVEFAENAEKGIGALRDGRHHMPARTRQGLRCGAPTAIARRIPKNGASAARFLFGWGACHCCSTGVNRAGRPSVGKR